MKLQVKGQRELNRVVALLEKTGAEKAVKLRMLREIRRGVRYIGAEQRKSLAAGLPKRGGMATTVTAQAKMGTSIRVGGKHVDVTLIDSWKGHDMKAIDRGSLRHPLYGNRGYWYSQKIDSLLLTKPFLRHRRTIQLGIIRSLKALADEIAKES